MGCPSSKSRHRERSFARTTCHQSTRPADLQSGWRIHFYDAYLTSVLNTAAVQRDARHVPQLYAGRSQSWRNSGSRLSKSLFAPMFRRGDFRVPPGLYGCTRFYITPALIGGAADQMVSYFIAFYTNTSANWGLACALSIWLLLSTFALYAVYNRLVGGMPGSLS